MSPSVAAVISGPVGGEHSLQDAAGSTGPPEVVDERPQRDVYADFLRALSLIVVIMWHWAFTILLWRDSGPFATNPIGFTSGMWILTWLLQVMPLFFYVGGYVHLLSWRRAQARGDTIWQFTGRRLRELAVPGGALLGTWIVLGVVTANIFEWQWIGKAVTLVVSPLWFLAVYLLLIALLPFSLWLHRKFDAMVLVWLVGLAMVVDILRFRYGVEQAAWANMIIIWGMCHQLGFFYEKLVGASRRIDWMLTTVGFFALVGLVGSGLYPGSMVGVPGETSNMAPPTLCIVALVLFQAGVAELLRPSLTPRIERPGWWRRATEVMTRFAMPLFLFHTTGMALSRAVEFVVRGDINESADIDLQWWLLRPLSVIGPLLFTLPVIFIFGRRWTRASKPAAAARSP